jgi:hypothetical protein
MPLDMLRCGRSLRAWSFALVASCAVIAFAPTPSPAIGESPACVRAIAALDADIDTARARAGDPFPFRIVHSVVALDGVAVPENAAGFGVVAVASHAQRGGRGGYVVIETRFVVLPNGTHMPVTIDWASAQGAAATGSSQNVPGFIGAVPFVGYVLGPYGFLHHGRDITIPRGAQIPVIVGDEEATGGCRVVPLASPSPSPLPSASPARSLQP